MTPRLVGLVLALAAPLAGQYRGPRSADYLLTTNAADARALWVNPAGLAVEYQASVMGELVVDRSRTGALALTQLTAGFNSRGIAFAYRRDLYNDTLTGHTWRIGASRALARFAVGFGLSFHSNGDESTQRGLDLGIRYRLLPTVEFGAAAREIGKPRVHGEPLYLNGSAGLGWQPMPSFRLDAEGTVTAETGRGAVRSWRGGVALGTARFSIPLHLQALLDLDEDFGATRLTLALTLGGWDRIVGVVSGARPGGSAVVNAVSLAGVASRVP